MKNMFVASGVLAASVCFAAAPTDVYLLIGQSNMAGRGELNATNRVDATRVLKWDAAAGEWVAGEEPINQDTDKPLAGLAASFARQMADESPDAVIGLVPAADAMQELRNRQYPGDAAPDEPYPDCRNLPVLNLPGGYKASKWSSK